MRARTMMRSEGPVVAAALAGGDAGAPTPRVFSADLPWRGPILGDDASGGAGLLFVVACDPGIGSAFGVACVPLLDGADPVPRLPGNGRRGVGLGDGEKTVKQALRGCVLWVPRQIESTTPFVRVRIPINAGSDGCSRMLVLLLSRLAPLGGGVRAVGEALQGGGTFREPYDMASVAKRGLGLPPDHVGQIDEFKNKLVDCIFDLIDPQRTAWTQLESAVLHHSTGRTAVSPKPDDACRAGQVKFFLASCLYPAGLFDGTPRHGDWRSGPADASLLRLARMIDAQKEQTPTILIISGDQIYADATAGVFDARLIDDRLHFAYERLYRGRGATEAFARVVPVMLIDDHEIRDNWEPEAPIPPSRRAPVDPNVIYQEPDNRGQRNNAVREYWNQERAHWQPLGAGSPLETPIDAEFRHGGADFRLLDTRTRRQRRTAATIGNARIVTKTQMWQLRQWLTRTKPSGTPRFIDTPSVFLPRQRVAIPAQYSDSLPISWASALRSDAWDGYPRSQHELLALLVREGHENVVFLSGDEHCSFVTWARITDLSNQASVVIRSIHSSGLYTPFPFANTDPDDLAGVETFEFDLGGARFSCEVKTEFFTRGAGFASVSAVAGDGGSWVYRVDFFGEDGQEAYQSSENDPWS